jgi:hypothetical protein
MQVKITFDYGISGAIDGQAIDVVRWAIVLANQKLLFLFPHIS